MSPANAAFAILPHQPYYLSYRYRVVVLNPQFDRSGHSCAHWAALLIDSALQKSWYRVFRDRHPSQCGSGGSNPYPFWWSKKRVRHQVLLQCIPENWDQTVALERVPEQMAEAMEKLQQEYKEDFRVTWITKPTQAQPDLLELRYTVRLRTEARENKLDAEGAKEGPKLAPEVPIFGFPQSAPRPSKAEIQAARAKALAVAETANHNNEKEQCKECKKCKLEIRHNPEARHVDDSKQEDPPHTIASALSIVTANGDPGSILWGRNAPFPGSFIWGWNAGGGYRLPYSTNSDQREAHVYESIFLKCRHEWRNVWAKWILQTTMQRFAKEHDWFELEFID